jgi:hypothetical protein
VSSTTAVIEFTTSQSQRKESIVGDAAHQNRQQDKPRNALYAVRIKPRAQTHSLQYHNDKCSHLEILDGLKNDRLLLGGSFQGHTDLSNGKIVAKRCWEKEEAETTQVDHHVGDVVLEAVDHKVGEICEHK